MTPEQIEVRAESAPWSNGLNLLIKSGHAHAKEILFETIPEGQIVNPTVTISRKQG